MMILSLRVHCALEDGRSHQHEQALPLRMHGKERREGIAGNFAV